MKFLHIGDLHIGKRVNELSMLEEQRNILKQIVDAAVLNEADGVLIAGDIYDKSVPPAEAVGVFDGFLNELTAHHIPVFAVSGNHDSVERLAFASGILEKQDVHFSRVFSGALQHVRRNDAYGPVNIWLMPFLKPANVRTVFPETDIGTYDDAIRCVIEHCDVDPLERNVLLAHQFVVSGGEQPERSESETVTVGGVDSVDGSIFDCFDYVALGHIHGPQWIGRETVRYCGSPLKYSFSEIHHKKSITVVELKEKGSVSIDMLPLKPLHDMREIRGPVEELLSPLVVAAGDPEDYMHVTLTDDGVMDAAARVRSVYPNLMKLDFDNAQTREHRTVGIADMSKRVTDLELFAEFYELQNNEALSGEKLEYMKKLFEEVEVL